MKKALSGESHSHTHLKTPQKLKSSQGAYWFIHKTLKADLIKLCAFHAYRDGWSMVAMQIGCLCVLFGCFAHLNGMDTTFRFAWLRGRELDDLEAEQAGG